MKCSEVLDKFILKQKVMNNSEETIKYYRKRIGYFINFIENKDINKLTIDDYDNYVLFLQKKKTDKGTLLSSHTIKTTLNAVKIFLKYSFDYGYMKSDFYKKIKPYKCLKKVIVVLSNEEIQKLLATQNEFTKVGCRNLLIISLMLDIGLRLNEVCLLEVEDFNLDLGLIRILGKGNKERLVPLTDDVKKYFLRYLFISEICTGTLFIDFDTNLRLTPSGISQIFRRIRKEHKFKKLHPHYLRHSFATLYLLNGGDPLHLQLMLGHTTLYMTEQYVHFAEEMTLPQQKEFCPLSNLKK